MDRVSVDNSNRWLNQGLRLSGQEVIKAYDQIETAIRPDYSGQKAL